MTICEHGFSVGILAANAERLGAHCAGLGFRVMVPFIASVSLVSGLPCTTQ